MSHPLSSAVFHHAQITVRDIERSRRFYVGVLGFREVERPKAFPYQGTWFESEGGQQIHVIIIPTEPLWHSAEKMEIFETHMAFRVPSFRAALEHFKSHGYSEDHPDDHPLKLVTKTRSPTGFPQIYVLDPDGHLTEINAAKLD